MICDGKDPLPGVVVFLHRRCRFSRRVFSGKRRGREAGGRRLRIHTGKPVFARTELAMLLIWRLRRWRAGGLKARRRLKPAPHFLHDGAAAGLPPTGS